MFEINVPSTISEEECLSKFVCCELKTRTIQERLAINEAQNYDVPPHKEKQQRPMYVVAVNGRGLFVDMWEEKRVSA